MNLYSVNNGERCPFDAMCMAVWARSAEDAVRYYRTHYPEMESDDDDNDIPYSGEVDCYVSLSRPDEPAAEPHQETDPETLREIGWRYDDERQCEHCGLYAFGIDEHKVCDVCWLCHGCRPSAEDRERCGACQGGEVTPCRA